MGVFTQTKQYVGDISIVAYVGPGDVVSNASMWVGLRAYSKASIGTSALRLRRDSDQAESDFATIYSGGLDLPAISSFKGAANLFVTKLYDQTGNGIDAIMATAAQQPSFTLSGLGTLPTITFAAASSQGLRTAASVSGTIPGTMVAVANHPASAVQMSLIYNAGAAQQLGYRTSANDQVFVYSGIVFSATASDGNWHGLQAILGSSGSINVDGTQTTGDTGSGGGSGQIYLGGLLGSQDLTGSGVEFGYWPIGFSGAQLTSMNSNQRTYWGF